MTVIEIIEIFALVTGVAYVVLEILQKNAMWVVGILTGAACAYSFAVQRSWGMMGLNLYYIVMSVIGLVQWRKDGCGPCPRKPPSGALWASFWARSSSSGCSAPWATGCTSWTLPRPS